MPDPETTARTKGCQLTADLAGSIKKAGLEVNQVVSQNDLGWEKSEVKCRLYEQEKQCGKIQSASLRWLEMKENSHQGWNKMRS